MRVLTLMLCSIVMVQSVPLTYEDSAFGVIIYNFVDCINSDVNLCLKEHALKVTERLNSIRKLDIFDGVSLYNNGAKEARSLDTLPSDPEERRKQVTERLWSSATELFQNSDLELSYGGSDDEDESVGKSLNDVEESRGKKKKLKKKLKLLLPLAILGKIKAVIIVIGALIVIAASVFKIALLAKIAFVAKVIAIVKALILKKQAQEEHIPYIPYEEHGPPPPHGWEGGWSRSKKDGNALAYSAYKS